MDRRKYNQHQMVVKLCTSCGHLAGVHRCHNVCNLCGSRYPTRDKAYDLLVLEAIKEREKLCVH